METFSVLLALNKQLGKQSWCWWFETPSRSLWCHCNEINPYPLWEAPTNVSKIVISAWPQHAERTPPATILIIYTANQNGYLYGRHSWLILLISMDCPRNSPIIDVQKIVILETSSGTMSGQYTSCQRMPTSTEFKLQGRALNTLRSRQNGQQLVDDIFKGIPASMKISELQLRFHCIFFSVIQFTLITHHCLN